MSRGTYGRTSHKDIAQDARRLKPFMAASGGDTYRVRVSIDDTTPNYLEQKTASADTSVVITVTNPGADEGLDFSVAVYVAGEIADHAGDPDAHHSQSHVLATTVGLGSDHTVSGLTARQVLVATSATTALFRALQAADLPTHVLATNLALGSQHTISGAAAGQVLRASSATAANFQALAHSDLSGVTANQHHNQVHVITGSDHTVTGSALDVVGLSATNTLAVLTPSAAVTSATAALLRTDNNGRVRVQGIGLGAAAAANNWAIVPTTGGIGLASSGAARIIFTDDTTDQIELLSANVIIGGSTIDSNFVSGAAFQVTDSNMGISRETGASAILGIYHYGTVPQTAIQCRTARGTRSSPTATQTDDILGRFGGGGHDGSNFSNESRGYFQVNATAAFTPTSQPVRAAIFTTPSGSVAEVERYRVSAAGDHFFYLDTETLTITDAGSSGATEQDWIEVTVGGVNGYIRVFSSK